MIEELRPKCVDCPMREYDESDPADPLVCDLSALPIRDGWTCSLWEFLCDLSNRVEQLEDYGTKKNGGK